MDDLKEFVQKRPPTKASFGYGSGVFKQKGYTEKDEPQRDLIFVVKDIKDWHLANMEMNPKDYSLLGRIHLTASSKERIKGLNKITYFSQIKNGDNKYKYGVIEEDDFLYNLTTWENLFVVGRFHKPILTINSTTKIDSVIKYNRDSAFRIACLLAPKETTIKYLFRILCGLSYNGDTRMKFAENPLKVFNIVNGSYDLLQRMYLDGKDYISIKGNFIIIDHEQLLREIGLLPSSIVYYLAEKNTDLRDLRMVRSNIAEYIESRNRKESIYQTVESLKTNGIVRSVPYVLSKIKKKIDGK